MLSGGIQIMTLCNLFLLKVVTSEDSGTQTSRNTFLPTTFYTSSALNLSEKHNSKPTVAPDPLCVGNCTSLPAFCYDCKTTDNCKYGTKVPFNCTVKETADCKGNQNVIINFQCRYCFLTKPNKEHVCTQTNSTCKVNATPPQRVKGSCTVKDDVFCLGHRTFTKMMPCSWTSGYRWSVAFALSITLGGFGVDRFYLGYWEEGLGKLFSFGGLGVWTLIDVVLIGSGYLGPAEGSLYVH